MTGGAWAVVIAAVLCIAALIGWVVISERLDRAAVPVYAPRHVPRPAVTLPVAGRLEPVPEWEDEDEPDAGWQAQCAPPDAVEILTAPARIAQTAQLTASVLERVREGLLGVEPDGTTATFTPAPGIAMPVSDDPDTTGVHPHAVGTWGKPADELADELAERYLT